MKTTLLIDAVHTLISSDAEGNIDSRTLNTTLADYLTIRPEMIIVVTNARGPHYAKIRSLLADYEFETHTMDNNPPKTDPEYWAHVMIYYGLDPQECFLVDHSEENLAAAGQIEIEGSLFVDSEQAIEVLERMKS